MKRRMIVAGTLGLVLALVWAMAFLYQRHNVNLLMAMLRAEAPPSVRISSFWSLFQIGTTALLAIPVAATSIGTMAGARPMVRMLRLAAGSTAVLSVGTLLIFAGLATRTVARGGGLDLLANPRIYYELLVALSTLGLQAVVLVLCRRSSGNDPGGDLKWTAASDGNPTPDKSIEPSRPLQILSS
jgi:hypothetical protein